MSRSDVTLVPKSDGEREDIRRALLVLATKQWTLESIAKGVTSSQRVAIVYSWAESDHGIFSVHFSPATYLFLGVNADDRTLDGRTLLTDSMKLLLGRLSERLPQQLAQTTIH